MTDISRHPVLRAIYGASQAIEKCGASRELTDAVVAVTALYAPAEGLLDHIASLERQLEDAKAQLAERTRESANEVADLAMLVARLARALDKPGGNAILAGQAKDYLRRHELNGSPLRAALAAKKNDSGQGERT